MFGGPDTFSVNPPVLSWGSDVVWPDPPKSDDAWKHDSDKKKLFGFELAKRPDQPFEAACAVLSDTGQALWAKQYWISDPIVIAAKESYAIETKLLDKEALSLKILKFAEEKDLAGRFYLVEAKDRLAALKLYAEIQGYIGKVDINASTNNYTNNSMKIVFVKPENNDNQKTIETSVEEIQPEIELLPANVKLVSTR